MIETYKRAETIATTIEYEIKNHIFDPQMYVKADLRKFWAVNLLEQFENKKMKQIAPAYKRIYRRAIRVAKEFFKIQDVRDIHKVDIDNYVEDCRQRYTTWGDKTLKNNIDIFKTFMNYLHDLEVISKVPAFSTIDYTDKTFKWVSGDEQIKLYNMVPDKHKPFIGFLMLHGCRPGEARALKCKDVDLEKRAMTITASFSGNVYQLRRKGKKSKPYIIPIHPEMYDYVAAIVKNAHPEAFLLPNPNTGRPYSMKVIETLN